MFKKNVEDIGLDLLWFEDDYGEKCSLQESSAVEPHIWLGIHYPKLRIMFKDSEKLGLGLKKQCEECNENGWCDYPIPEEVFIDSRMHLNREQAKKLGRMLIKFSKKGRLY